MKRITPGLNLLIAAGVFLSGCASGRPSPVNDPVGAAIAQPFRDLNLIRETAPAALAAASADPYGLARAGTCAEIAESLSVLNAVLGPDVDAPADAPASAALWRPACWAANSTCPIAAWCARSRAPPRGTAR